MDPEISRKKGVSCRKDDHLSRICLRISHCFHNHLPKRCSFTIVRSLFGSFCFLGVLLPFPVRRGRRTHQDNRRCFFGDEERVSRPRNGSLVVSGVQCYVPFTIIRQINRLAYTVIGRRWYELLRAHNIYLQSKRAPRSCFALHAHSFFHDGHVRFETFFLFSSFCPATHSIS